MSNGISNAVRNSAAVSLWQAPAQPISLLGWLKGLFVTPNTSAAQFETARKSFEIYFEREAGALANVIGPKAVSGFADDVQAKFESIVKRTFEALPRGKSGSVVGKDFAAMMKLAGKEAAMALDRLKVDAARAELTSNLEAVDLRPQIILKDNKFVVVRAAPQLENLVLKGGGAKGIGYSAALDQMEKAGMLSGLRHIAGSSAGALTATCLAAGLTAEQFEKGPADVIFRPDISGALKGDKAPVGIYPGLKLEGGLLPAVNAVKAIDETTARSVQSVLKQHWNTSAFQEKIDTMVNEGRLTLTQQKRLIDLQTLPNFDEPHEASMITFGDLKLLNDLAPEKFKRLTLTGWNMTDQKEEYFDDTSCPHMPVAYAARISMAFPIAFKAVALNEGSDRKVYADGGIGSNLPSEVFEKKRDADGVFGQDVENLCEEQKARTLLMTFDENGKAYQIMHRGPPKRSEKRGMLNKITACLSNWITTHPDRTSSSIQDRYKVWNAGPNAIPVFHGKLGTLSSGVNDEKQHQVHMLSAWKTLEQIEVRTQQAYHVQYSSLEQLASQLTNEEIHALRTRPEPDVMQCELLAILDQAVEKAAPPASLFASILFR